MQNAMRKPRQRQTVAATHWLCGSWIMAGQWGLPFRLKYCNFSHLAKWKQAHNYGHLACRGSYGRPIADQLHLQLHLPHQMQIQIQVQIPGTAADTATQPKPSQSQSQTRQLPFDSRGDTFHLPPVTRRCRRLLVVKNANPSQNSKS